MKGKLIKTDGTYVLTINKYQDEVFAISDFDKANNLDKQKLSLKNCESIVNDFDLYGEAVDYAARQGHPSPEGFSDEQVGLLHGYIDGFQKAIETMVNNKFTAEDMRTAFSYGMDVYAEPNDWDKINPYRKLNNHIQSLQPNSWDVEIVMDCVIGCENLILNDENSLCCGNKKPKLDENNCLIIKRI